MNQPIAWGRKFSRSLKPANLGPRGGRIGTSRGCRHHGREHPVSPVRTFKSHTRFRTRSGGRGVVGARRGAASGLGAAGRPPAVTWAASRRDAASAANTVLVSAPIHPVHPALFGGAGVAAGLTEGLVIE